MNKPVILANGTDQLLLPYDNASAFSAHLADHHGALATWTAWVVPKTMKPADAARQAGMSEAQLREVNKIPPKMLVRAGSTLLVPRTAKRDMDVSEHLADTAIMNLTPDVPPLRKVTFKAGKGDSVASIARRYRVGTAQVAQWNKVSSKAGFRPGQQVVIYTADSGTRLAIKSASSSSSKPSTKRTAKAQPRLGGHATLAAKDGGLVQR